MTSDSGIALLAAVMTTMVLAAVGGALILATTIETSTAANFVRRSEAAYAADAIAERALVELAAVPDWNQLLAGTSRSPAADGAPTGTRTLADGTVVNLDEIVNVANCGRPAGCTAAQVDAVTTERPWGANNPRWQLFAYSPLTALLPPGSAPSPFYVVLLVGDDASENDGNAAVDGGPPAVGEPANPGAGILSLRAEAFGPAGAHGQVELSIRRSVRVLSWREIP
jgi:hypothetical protein